MNQNADSSLKSNPENSRFVAYKLSISEILHAPIGQDGLLQWKECLLGRVNLFGTIISLQKKEAYQNVFVDDGTGSLLIRIFGQENFSFNVGDVLQVIGRPRLFGQERYIAPEITTKITDLKWVTLRKKEKEVLQRVIPMPKKESDLPEKQNRNVEQCLDLIKNEDKGDGVDVELLLTQAVPEELIYELLKGGSIFETKPGKVKILD